MATTDTRTFDLTSLLSGPYYCVGCAGRVCKDVLATPGVTAADCDLEAGALSVTYDPSTVRPADLERLVARLALAAEDRVAHATYRVTGLD